MTLESEIWAGWENLATVKQSKLRSQQDNARYGEKYRAQERLRNCIEDEAQVLSQLRRCCPELYHGDFGVTLSDKSIAKLLAKVLEGSGGYSYRNRHNFLVKGLLKGSKELGWSMTIPAPVTVELTEPSMFTPESFSELSDGRALYKAFWAGQHQTTPKKTESNQRHEAGQLLFSCLMDSACLSRHWLGRLPEGIRQGCGVHQKIVWVELEQEVTGDQTGLVTGNKGRRRRFFPAPTTQLLLQRWYERWHNDWPKQARSQEYATAQALLLEYATGLGKSVGISRVNYSRLFSMAETRVAQQLPGFLVHYLRSRDLGTSIPEANWLRLVSGKHLAVADGPTESLERGMPSNLLGIELLPLSRDFPDQFQLFYRLKRIIDKKKGGTKQPRRRAETLAAVKEFGKTEALAPVTQLLTIWAYSLLRMRNGGRYKLRPSSVVRYLDLIGKHLLAQASAFRNPAAMDEDEWQAIYDNCLMSAKGKSSGVSSMLADFHKFLRINYDAPAVEIERAAGSQRVDAHIITPREYGIAKRILRQRTRDELSDVLELVLILGFRCGLRRGEVWSRLINDFDGFDNPAISRVELLVRPNKWAGIKSWCGTRRLPLWSLLEEEELALLRSFYRRRRDRLVGSGTHHALFAQDMASGNPFDEDEVFGVITDTLKLVTKDNYFKFHRLRHSFVSFTLLRLMETDRQKHIPASWACGDEGKSLFPIRDRPLALVVSAEHSFSPLAQVSLWAGHASSSETLYSYSHLLDWLARSYIWERRNPLLSVQEQSALLGKKSGAVEKYRNRSKAQYQSYAAEVCDVFVRQWRKTALRKLPKLSDRPISIPNLHVVQGEAWSPDERLLAAYELAYQTEEVVENLAGEKHPRGLEAAAEKLKVPIIDAERWINNAKILMSMLSSRERFPAKELAARGPEPKKPRLSTGGQDIKRPLDQKDPSRGWPEVPGVFMAPPRTPKGLRYSTRWYQELLDWEARSPQEAQNTMRMVLEHAQRTRARIKVRAVEEQIKFGSLLKVLGLAPQLRLEVSCLPDADKKRIRKHWAVRFGVPLFAVSINPVESPEARIGINGRPHLFVEELKDLVKYSDDEERRKNYDTFWRALRFALMSALVVTGKLRAGTRKGAKKSGVLTEFDELLIDG